MNIAPHDQETFVFHSESLTIRSFSETQRVASKAQFRMQHSGRDSFPPHPCRGFTRWKYLILHTNSDVSKTIRGTRPLDPWAIFLNISRI